MIIGIDPGKAGAVALLSTQGKFLCALYDTSARSLVKLLADWPVTFAFVEKAQAMPKNGAVSMFTYGQGFGEILGVLASQNVPYELVPPRTWTKEMLAGVPATLEGKARARMACERLFPAADLIPSPRSKIPHIGLVDAILIAEWGRRKRFGNQGKI